MAAHMQSGLGAASLWDLPPGTLDTLCLPGLRPPNPYRPLHGVPVVSAWSYFPPNPLSWPGRGALASLHGIYHVAYGLAGEGGRDLPALCS